jgi:hypothetical protein
MFKNKTKYRITVEEIIIKAYYVDAETGEEAREMWQQGDLRPDEENCTHYDIAAIDKMDSF